MATYYVDAAVGNDSNAGTSAGSGNAWATLSHAASTVAAGDTVNVKGSGSYNETLSLTTTAGTETAPITFIGYTTTPGDGGQFTIDGQNTRAACVAVSKLWQRLQNVILTGATTRAIDITAGLTNGPPELWNCSLAKGSGGAVKAIDSSNFNVHSVNCRSCTFNGFSTNISASAVLAIYEDCLFTSCGPLQMSSFSTTLEVRRCRFVTPATKAIIIQASDVVVTIEHCSIYSTSTTNPLIDVSAGTFRQITIRENVLRGGTYGIAGPSPQSYGVFNDYNAFYSQLSGQLQNLTAGPRSVTLSAEPFTSGGTGDLSLNATAGGGAACRGAGAGGFDLGALQSVASGGGSGGIFHQPNYNGGYE